MDEQKIEAFAERLEFLTREQRRLTKAFRLRTRVGAAVACYAVILTIWGVFGFRPIIAQEEKGLAPAAPPGPLLFISPPPPHRLPIQPYLGIKNIQAEYFGLMSEEGPCLMSLLGNGGTTSLRLNATDERPRIWLRVDQAGEPSLVFFDKKGESPVELVVTRRVSPESACGNTIWPLSGRLAHPFPPP